MVDFPRAGPSGPDDCPINVARRRAKVWHTLKIIYVIVALVTLATQVVAWLIWPTTVDPRYFGTIVPFGLVGYLIDRAYRYETDREERLSDPEEAQCQKRRRPPKDDRSS